MMWPLVAAVSAVGSLYLIPRPRPLLAMGAAALIAFLFLNRPPALAAVTVYPEVDRIVGSLKFARAYTAGEVEGVGDRLQRFLGDFHAARMRPSPARLQSLEMARAALVRDVLSIIHTIPPSCHDHAIVEAARAAHGFTSACIEQVRAAMGLSPDTAPEPIAFDAGAPVA